MALFVMKAKEGEGAGSTKEAVTRDQFGRLRVPVPTLEKQDEIATLLGAETGKLKRLATDAERTISLLKNAAAL